MRETSEHYGVDEFCCVISSSVSLTNADGNSETFGPGESFVIPRDFRGVWHNAETMRKFWMIYEPPAAG